MARLACGLASRTAGPVDVDSLLAGARTGARRIRRRRRLGATAVVVAAVVAVPVGLMATRVIAGRSRVTENTVSATADPSFAVASPGMTGAVPPQPGDAFGGPDTGSGGGTSQSGPPSEVSGGQPASGVARMVIDDAAVLQPDDIGVTAVRVSVDRAVTADTGPTVRRVCRTVSTAVGTVAGGRRLDYVEVGPVADPWTVTTLVRVLPARAAATEVAGLRKSMDGCTSDLRLSQAKVGGVPGVPVLGYQIGAPSLRPKSVLVLGVVQQGRTTASVELVVPARAARDDAGRVQVGLSEARRLLTLADARLISSGLVALAAADPRLS